MRNEQLNTKLQWLNDNMHSVESKEELLISEFRSSKYTYLQYAFIVAYLLYKKRGMNDELAFHLFCHSAHLGMYSLAAEYLEMIKDSEFYRELIIEFPVPENICQKSSLQGMLECMERLSERDNASAMFETGISLIRMGCNECEDIIMRSFDHSQHLILPRLILKYHDALTDMDMNDKAMAILEKFAMKDNAHPSVLYRYGKSLEHINSDRAIEIFKQIMDKYDDYLDTEERISNLTKKKKHSKIYNYEQEEDIHFS